MGCMINGFHGGNCMILHVFSLWKSRVMRRLRTGIRSKKCVVRRFRHCANIIECTYTNLDSIILIVVFPRMLTIIQLLFQQNAHVFCY
jgi:hypothetical protein